jgi:dolichol-phosphate mannosyltransferase
VLGAISTVDIPWDTGDYRLMDRKVVDALASLPEKTRFIRGMIPWLGFKQVGIAIDRGAREVGESTYTLKKLISLAMDGLLAFSSAPLYLISVFGMILTGLALLVAISALIFAGDASKGGVLLASAVAFFSGLQIMCVGIVAVYLSRVLDETRARPTYIVGAKLGSGFMAEAGNEPTAGGREVVRSSTHTVRV